MFRNNLVVLADPPSSSPFLLRQLSLLPALSQPTSSSLAAVEVETLCWKISRRWRLACFLHHPDVFVIYQVQALVRSRLIPNRMGVRSSLLDSSLLGRRELNPSPLSAPLRNSSKEYPASIDKIYLTRTRLILNLARMKVGAEEEVASASLVTKAVEIVFRTVMLDHKWACVGNNTFVDSAFAGTDERKNVGAFNLRVQSEMDDGFVLLVSPEVLRFSRYKVTDFVSSEVWESFDNGEIVMFKDYGFLTACTIIPTLSEAHVIGVCKLLPDEENFERLELLWSLKHGLALNSEYFISVQLAYGSYAIKWLPSAYILQDPSFSPAPQTPRSAKAVDVIDSFMKIFGAWDFFSQGQLKVKEVSSLGIVTKIPVWTTATNKFPCCMARNKENADIQNSLSPKHLTSRDLKLALDFRAPKPGIQFVHGSRMLELNNVKETATCGSNLNISTENIQNDVNACSTSDTLPAVMKGPPVSISIESGPVNGSYFAEVKHSSAEYDLSVDPSQRLKGSKWKKEKTKAFLGSNVSENSGKEDTAGGSKMRAKQCVDQSVITAKVMDYYKSGELQSLTMVDLKCFLTSKKAKVGGKKEELIKRVTSLLA
uniref:SAP domain-containing protein n=1 Tax=Musa acuminata subsp. malaccensis TaxID=214687 RepID=A0A804K7T5_MUSAM